MSGIGGVLRLDGGSIDPADVTFLTDALARRGPDGVGQWHGDGVALVQAVLRATPEAPVDPGPLADETGTLRIVFDGRLDNRDELRSALGAAGMRRRKNDADAEMVLQAYRYWDRACVQHLNGDFSFALWDGRRRRLFCGRDRLGMKPFVYRSDGYRLAWASDLRPVALFPGASSRPNLGMVAEFLANNVASLNETVWSDVYRLPPAHSLTVERGRVSLTRYWDLDPTRQIRYRSSGEYGEHLREVLADAVSDRTRTVGPSVVELSGGIDSSALTGLAMKSLAGRPSEAVRAVSLVYPGLDCDESEHIDAVAKSWDLDPIRVTPIPAGTFDYEAEAYQFGDIPAYPAMALWAKIYAAARDLGARSTLNGIGGDEWFTGTAAYTADLIRAGRLKELVAHSMDAARFHQRSVAAVIWYYGVRSLVAHRLPPWIVNPLRGHTATRGAPWVRAAFARSVGLRDRLVVPERPNLATIAQGQICHTLDGGVLTNAVDFTERFVSDYALEFRAPFLDSRVIEFALAIPEAERWGADHPKRVLRSAVRGLVPESVLGRLDKEGPGYIFAEELLSPETASCLRSPVIEREGWVDGDRLRAMHTEMGAMYRASASGWDTHIWPLWRAVAVEIWLRANGYG